MNCQDPPFSLSLRALKLSSRLVLLAATLLGLALAATFVIHRTEQIEQAVLVESGETALGQNLEHAVQLTSEGMRTFVEDYSWWDEMVEFVSDPDPTWAEVNFEDALEFWQVAGLWVFDPSAELVYAHSDLGPAGLAFPLDQTALWETCQADPFPHFFRSTPEGMLELRGAPIQPGEDAERTSEPKGWFLVARRWDERLFQKLVPADTGVMLQIVPPTADGETASDPTHLEARLPLRDESERLVAHLQARLDKNEILHWKNSGLDETTVMLVYALGSIVLLLGCLELWVFRPIREIDRALRSGTPTPILGLSRAGDEFGEISRLIIDSFTQADRLRSETQQRRDTESALRESEEALRRTLQDWSQLGLNLHDSTIQTLYASGMSLIAVENRNPDLPAETRSAIREVRRNLQTTIDELRSFIGQTETTLSDNSLSDSITTMLAFLRNTSQVQIQADIDEVPNDLLDPEQKIHLLQILRESVTNALRHAQAQTITVHLHVRPGLVRLRVEDDGIGLPRAAPESSSRGLHNIHRRAELAAAELKIKSRPGGGTRIDLDFRPHDRPANAR